jgi:hypothetical protein
MSVRELTPEFDETAEGMCTPGEPDAADQSEPASGGFHLTRTQWALLAWAVFLGVFIWLTGVPTSRTKLFTVIGTGLFATTAGNPRAWARIVRDWAPLFLILSVYDVLRMHANEWQTVHFLPQIHVDRWLFGGAVPTVQLQHWLFTPGRPHWWDYGVFLVYMSHFFASLIVAAVLWKYSHARFQRFAFLFVSLSFLAFVTYALYPAAPPWLASQTAHGLGPTAKVIDEMWVHIGLRSGASVFSGTSHLANPVAAVPSLHSAYPVLLVLFFWKSAGKWRWLLPLYPLAMGFTLVYAAEHYVFDILLGWLYAVVVYFVGSWAFDRYKAWRGERVLIGTAVPATAPARTVTA